MGHNAMTSVCHFPETTGEDLPEALLNLWERWWAACQTGEDLDSSASLADEFQESCCASPSGDSDLCVKEKIDWDQNNNHVAGDEWIRIPDSEKEDWFGKRIAKFKKQVEHARPKDDKGTRWSQMCWLTLCTYKPRKSRLDEVTDFDKTKTLLKNCEEKV